MLVLRGEVEGRVRRLQGFNLYWSSKAAKGWSILEESLEQWDLSIDSLIKLDLLIKASDG